MARYADNVQDQHGRPVSGALVYVYTQANELAALTTDEGGPLEQPITTDRYGAFSFNTSAGIYNLKYWFGGKEVYTDNGVAAGADLPLPDAVTVVLGSPAGASYVRAKDGKTVQQKFDDLEGEAGASNIGTSTGTVQQDLDALRNKQELFVTARDFGAVGDGVADDTAALQAAITASAVRGAALDLVGGIYRTTAKINAPLAPLRLHMRNGTVAVDHPGVGIGQATAGGGANIAARHVFENVRVVARQNATAAWDCVTFQYCQWINCFVGASGGKFGTAWKLSNVSYWNALYSPEVEAVADYGWDLNGANDTRFFMPRHVDFSGSPKAAIFMSGGCSGVSVFGPSFEAPWSQQPVQFHAAATNNGVFGGRCELRAGGVATQAVKFNGSAQNTVTGLYALGFTSVSDAIGNNQALISTGSAGNLILGRGQFFPSTNTTNADTAGGVIYNTATNKFTGYDGGGPFNFFRNTANEHLDYNGWRALNMDGCSFNGPAFSPGSGKVSFGNGTQTTVGAAGAAAALPTTPSGYLIAYVGTTRVAIPYYAAS